MRTISTRHQYLGWSLAVSLCGCSPTPSAPQSPPQHTPELVAPAPTPQVAEYNVIPRPRMMEPRAERFVIEPTTRIAHDGKTPKLLPIVRLLAERLGQVVGTPLKVSGTLPESPHQAILFRSDAELENDEAYQLDISADRIEIHAKTPAGAFYAVQTLTQLLPANDPSAQVKSLELPGVHIEDAPRFAYRGLMLDVGRHFYPADFVKRMLDTMALYKLNRFHWHLTDDQGWRIEIKKYPKLTEVGAYRDETLIGHAREAPPRFDGKRYGGFYTQEQIKDVVAYAAERFITVIPEIEMPGHSSAALAAYPELACSKGPFEVVTSWGIFDDIYCPSEKTFGFLEDVLTEVIALFPSQYIHIGGDEAPKVAWENSKVAQGVIQREKLKDEAELQSYFIRRIEKFLSSKGRKLIGWDEIIEGGLAPSATVMSWRSLEAGITAAKAGHDVIMTPNSHLYFDRYQDDAEAEPLAFGGYTPIEKVYEFEPVPSELNAAEASHVLGAQANVWTEYMSQADHVEYMVFPRLQALSEVVWSQKDRRSWTDFCRRLPSHLKELERRGIDYSRAFFKVKQDAKHAPDGTLEVTLTSFSGDEIRFSVDGSPATSSSPTYTEPLKLSKTTTVSAVTVAGDEVLSKPVTANYVLSLATGKPVEYEQPFSPKYASTGAFALTDGLRGSKNYGDGRWLGFEGSDLVATLDLGKAISIESIEVGFLRDVGTWIMLPKTVEYLVSSDGERFERYAILETQQDDRDPEPLIENYTAKGPPKTARYVRVVAKNYGNLPSWHPGKNTPAWLFTDQLLVNGSP